MTLGSLFDGSGTAPLAARMCGIEPVWCSEIEPFPIAVTRARFPQMKHYGNICDIKGDKIEPVDIICGGSPCQDLSVAGKRAGLEGGERSILFHEQIRIIKEMRNADKLRCERLRNSEIRDRDNAHVEGGKAGLRGNNRANDIRPRYAIWENVPGAYSSNKGEDFRCVLEAFCQIADETADIPRPAEGRWAAAGCIVGNGWSVAYRTLDAQYFGVPQRRRRIFLVADFGSECAAEILSEQEGLLGNIAEGGETRESAAGKIEGGVGEASGVVSKGNGECWLTPDKHMALSTGGGQAGQGYPCVMTKEPIKVLPFNERQITSPQNGNNPDYGDPCHTLSATDGAPTICIQGSVIGRADHNGPQGSGISEDVSFTLNTIDRHAVCEPAVCYAMQRSDEFVESEVSHTLAARDYKSATDLVCRDIVRRLTPKECQRLQGFPDGWCSDISIPNPTESDISFWRSVWDTYQSINGKKPKPVKQIITWLKHPHSDSAEYKMWGNGMALPCVLYIMRGIISAERPIT